MTNPTYPYQNPVYPPPMPVPEMEIIARQTSMIRAQSPGERVCLIDQAYALETPGHTHPFDECMSYRHDHVVADDDPWTYWQLLDQVVSQFMAPPPPPPQPPVDWNARARVVPGGISQMDGFSEGWQGFSFATLIGPSKISLGPGTQTRVTLVGNCQFNGVWIGPCSSKPFVAQVLYQLTFGGQGWGYPQPGGNFISDPLPHGFDCPNGLIVSGYIADVGLGLQTAYLGHRTTEADWYSRWSAGQVAHIPDMTRENWRVSPYSSNGVLMVEAFY